MSNEKTPQQIFDELFKPLSAKRVRPTVAMYHSVIDKATDEIVDIADSLTDVELRKQQKLYACVDRIWDIWIEASTLLKNGGYRTCYDDTPYGDFTCSECGYCPHAGIIANYCPNCGRKVVDETDEELCIRLGIDGHSNEL